MNNLEIIKVLYQAFEQGDIPSILNVLDPHVEWIESEGIPYGGTFIGHEAVVQGVFQKIGAEWENFQATVEEFIDAGEKIITVGVDRGTYKATGKAMEAATVSAFSKDASSKSCADFVNLDVETRKGCKVCAVY